jgi:hypothetical protein
MRRQLSREGLGRTVVVLSVGILLGLTMHSAIVHSAVCDEIGAHIPAGYLYWTSGHYGGGLDNFPLG